MSKSNAPVSPQVGYVLLVATWLCWGFSYPATAFVLDSMDVWSSRVLVMTAAATVLLVLGWMQGASLAVPRSYWRDLTIAAICNMAVFQICMTYGVQLLSAGRTSVIVYTMPLWASIFAHFLLGERLTRARFAALCLGLVGLVVLIWQDLSHLRNAPVGAGLTLFAAILFALGVVWMKRRAWQNDPTVLAGWQLLIGAVPVTIIWSLSDATLSLSSLSRESWTAIVYLVVIANALAYFSWFRGIAAFPATVTGIGAMAVPIVGVMASAWLLDEKLGWREWLALALIISALAANLVPTLQRRTR
ncbi:MAG: EamA family transporter [Alphaproteobacteria bacterium]|nr:EamA family transporter [Alphaproteobacteria bacterium]